MKSNVTLDDKYALPKTQAYITGIEALVRLPILQHQRDMAAGLNTAGFVSGYRGSPLGGVDQAMWRAQTYLDQHHIHFQPGLNEDLAATSVWGSQQVNLFEGAKYDGVFSLWYGKGPGVDRSMDVIKHANAFGTARYGGVLAVAGDDHACKSSTLPHQSEHMFVGASIPVLSPANVQEVLDMGIYGWALSRYSGCWVGLKAITENMDSAMSAEIDPQRVSIIMPTDFTLPEEGVHGRWPSTPLEQERILNKYRIYAARHFAYANGLNRIVLDSPNPRLGIVTTGKSYLDVLQALDDLGIDEQEAARIGLRVFKLGMPWPLEPKSTHEFARGLEEILVVEEKRSLIEDQLTGQLYNWPVAQRPRVIGEFDEHGADLLPNLGELTPAMVARAIAARIGKFYDSQTMRDRLAFLQAKERTLAQRQHAVSRDPHFCSGCPHNRSTVVPEGSRAMGGIGCHYMVTWMNRETHTFTQMGGEGATWIGQAPFTETPHVFQNLGDGTYFHSGILAIRAAHAASVNITYKILYNDAVAMTGGQPHDGPLTVAMIVEQLRAEGIARIAVVSDDTDKYPADFPKFTGLTISDRNELDTIQRELRETSGTTVIIYDQTCAAEKRRRRRKGTLEDPDLRVVINEAVCEGCGDCGVASNCLSVLPKETALGRKRQIDQNACNKDLSCVDGFCPSFVTVSGVRLKTPKFNQAEPLNKPLPEPPKPDLNRPWNIVIGGIGGTGVLTISGILGMAAHLDERGGSTLNQTGLAQKFGSVISHVRIGQQQSDIYTARIPAGDADLLIGCDLVVANSDDAIAKLHTERSHCLINTFESPTAQFLQDPNLSFPADEMRAYLEAEAQDCTWVDATRIARALLGDVIGANLFLLGYAYQLGWIPLSEASIQQAITLNGVAVPFNQQAFYWGRMAAHDRPAIDRLMTPRPVATFQDEDPDILITDRYQRLVAYQNTAYAERYAKSVDQIRQADLGLDAHQHGRLTALYARYLYKLMAYKDEYEVARLYTDGAFQQQLNDLFEGKPKLTFHLAPPLLSKRDPHTGHPCKRRFGPMMMSGFRALAKLRFLRGTVFDPFGYTDERRLERQLIADYETDLQTVLNVVNHDNINAAFELLDAVDAIRGFGHVKLASLQGYRQRRQTALDKLHGRTPNVTHLNVKQIG